MHAAEAQPGGFSPHSVRLAWMLALAYLLVIVHASLQPYRGWRLPPDEILRFLSAPWPHYITSGDIIVNLAAYVPLGFLLSVGFSMRCGSGPGVIFSALCAAGLSLTMESAQMLLPARIASNVDLLANSLGALIGAMAAPLFAPTRILGGKLHAARHRLFVEGMAADVALVIACLWLVAQFHPTAQLFGTGSIRATFDLPAYFVHAPQTALSFEAAVVLLNLLGTGLMIAAFMRGDSRHMLAIGAVIGTALLIKTTAAALIRTTAPFAWLTPGVSLGLLAGWVLLYGAVRLPQPAQLVVAALCIALATAAINLAPGNPYQSVPLKLIAGGASHFLNFSGIVRALSELWPLLAISFLLYALAARQHKL
ncbi:MAG: VanZ family protein [Betaproteobacteria bacterium]|nr:VanZ family protein [Betaproteobacteria bacterium]